MIHKLRLKPGDVLIVRDHNDFDLVRRIADVGRHSNLKFNVPIISVRERHSLDKVPFEYLEQAYLTAKEAKEKETENAGTGE